MPLRFLEDGVRDIPRGPTAYWRNVSDLRGGMHSIQARRAEFCGSRDSGWEVMGWDSRFSVDIGVLQFVVSEAKSGKPVLCSETWSTEALDSFDFDVRV